MIPTKVLYADHCGFIRGGGQISLLELIRNLDKTRFAPYAVTGKTGEFQGRLTELGIRADVINMPSVSLLRPIGVAKCIQNILQIMKDNDIDIIHSNDTRSHVYCGIAAKIARKPCVFHYRVSCSDGLHDRLLPRFATKIIAASRSVAKRFPALPAEKCLVIYNGVDCRRFCRRPTAFRQEHQILEEAFLIGTIGRLSPEKGTETFVRAVSILATQVPTCHGIIVGMDQNGYKTQLMDLCENLNVSHKIAFLDRCDDLPAFYNALDVYSLFSQNEGFNRSIIEAMACEVPVIATHVGGNPEAIGSDGGILVLPSRPQVAAREITQLAQNPEKTRALGKCARQRVEERFAIHQHVQEIEKVYEETVQ